MAIRDVKYMNCIIACIAIRVYSERLILFALEGPSLSESVDTI